jgi:elongation factor P--(R)-beta-lysine ligase
MADLKTAWWHPEQYARRKPFLAVRQKVIAVMRAYFAGEAFAEVDTPALQVMPGGEVHLQAFATELKGPRPGPGRRLYLHTSPEIAMKKLIIAGVPRLYQIAHVFRNGEQSSLHQPEFSMCEWYRSGLGGGLFTEIMKDCVNLVRAAISSTDRKAFFAKGMDCDPFMEWETLTVAGAFARYANIDLLETAPDPLKPDAVLLGAELTRNGFRVSPGDTWDDMFFRVMGERIETKLGSGKPTFLCDYPASMAALARRKEGDPRVAERTELYICGIELANGFAELTDADEQLRRMQTDMAQKKKLYGEAWPIDEDFIAALRHGMPDCAGIALGVDRLVMLCAGAENIDDVLWAPVAKT